MERSGPEAARWKMRIPLLFRQESLCESQNGLIAR